METIKPRYILLTALFIAAGFKAVLILTDSVPFNGDEAVVATMARHILEGERPVFFYGQAYMGSLDAWLVAASFRIFGEGVLAIRILQSFLYLGFILTTWWLVRKWFTDKRIVGLVVILTAIPPIVVTTYTTATLGGYGESMVLGNLILGLGYDVVYGDRQKTGWVWLLLGLIGGLAFWTLGIAGVYLLPVGLIGLSKFDLKKLGYYAISAGGFIVGGYPWWNYNLKNSWAALTALSGSGLVETSLFERFFSLLVFGLPALVGMRTPWSKSYFPWILVFFTLLLHLGLLFYFYSTFRTGKYSGSADGRRLMIVMTISFILIFVITRFGIDATGRYLMPLYLPLVIGMGEFIAFVWNHKKEYGITLLMLALGINAYGTFLGAVSPDKITTQFDPITSFDNSHDAELIAFLEETGELRGYTNYWVSFRLAFLSNETIIFSSELPYKFDLSYSPGDDRYAPYSELVDDSQSVAYITSKHPDLDDILRTTFEDRGITFDEKQIGEFHIFYKLSDHIRPEEFGYGNAKR